MSDNFNNLISRLLATPRGFCLQKISPTTYPKDVITAHKRGGDKLTDTEIAGILSLLKSKAAFRCKVGKARFFYGATASDAIGLALKNEDNAVEWVK